jgi:hypothetical protein
MAVILLAGCALVPRPLGGRAGGAVALRDGAQSIDELVQDFVVAVHRKDEDTLRSLRVNSKEYRELIIPGSVDPQEPPRQFTDDWLEFLWGRLDVRNRYGERDLLRQYGGRTLVVEEAAFRKSVREYRGYTAHRQLDLKLRDDLGAEVTFEMGSIAQVGDRYKFISFTRD